MGIGRSIPKMDTRRSIKASQMYRSICDRQIKQFQLPTQRMENDPMTYFNIAEVVD